jgi:hypothetical protein
VLDSDAVGIASDNRVDRSSILCLRFEGVLNDNPKQLIQSNTKYKNTISAFFVVIKNRLHKIKKIHK